MINLVVCFSDLKLDFILSLGGESKDKKAANEEKSWLPKMPMT